MNTAIANCKSLWLGLCLFLLVVAGSQTASAELAGRYRSAPGSLATYVYHVNGYEAVLLPADISVRFAGSGPFASLAATIHEPIIGDTEGPFDYPIVHEFPLVVTGTSNDGRRFQGDLFGTQYLFDWEFDPAAGGGLLWNGHVYWAGGRIEQSTIADALLVPVIAGDYNEDGSVGSADYVTWRDALGHTGPALAADGNGDNQVDQTDFDVWRDRFGQSAGGGSLTSGTIPEPTAMAMLFALLPVFLGCRWAGVMES